MPDRGLIERFRSDLAALWPGVSGGETDKLGLAISGGPDSLALLLLAHGSLPGRIEAATVDHGLRPEAAGEAEFVSRICEELGIPHRTLTVAVAEGNVQAEARKARYRALDQWMDHRGLAMLATAHHADDQAETVLMRLNRGSGLHGLAGIRPLRRIPGSDRKVCRPVLLWRKAELETVVSDCGLEPVSDPSNSDPVFDRARIRRALETADWLDPCALARSVLLLGEAEETLARLAEETFSRSAARGGDGFELQPPTDNYLKVEIVRRIFAELGAEPSRSEIAQCVSRLEQGRNASLAGVLATPSQKEGDEGMRWVFRPEPPRQDS